MKYILKYLFLAIAKVVLLCLLIIERFIKLIISIVIIVWNFRFNKKEHTFWGYYNLIIPAPVVILIPIVLVAKSLKDYFNFNFEVSNNVDKNKIRKIYYGK